MTVEMVNPLSVGDMILPSITRKGDGWNVEPIVLWEGIYKGKRRSYTAATPLGPLPGSYPPSVKFVGWCNPLSGKYVHGVKVFIPLQEEPALKANEAIKVVRVSLRCAIGEVVEFVIKG